MPSTPAAWPSSSGADCYRYGEPDCGPGAPTRVITHLYSTPRTALVNGLPVYPH